jgi:hypothetical protein
MAKANAAQGATTTALTLTPAAKTALALYYKEKKASGKDVWEQEVPMAQYSIRPFAQPAVLEGRYPKKPSETAKAMAAHLGCSLEGNADVAHVHCQLVRADGTVAAKATMTELGDELNLNADNIHTMFQQPYTMSCTKGDIANGKSRKWTIS